MLTRQLSRFSVFCFFPPMTTLLPCWQLLSRTKSCAIVFPMSENPELPEIPEKPKRHRGRPRKVRADKGVARLPKPTPASVVPSKALGETDSRLARAIEDRAHAVEQASKVAYWQGKIIALDQEINTLIDFSNRLTGQNRAPASHAVDPIDILRKTTLTGTVTPTYDFRNEVPAGVGSIPAGERPKGPRPSSGNAADQVKGEPGFQ